MNGGSQNGNTVQNDEWVEKPDSRQRQTEAEQETQDHGGFQDEVQDEEQKWSPE